MKENRFERMPFRNFPKPQSPAFAEIEAVVTTNTLYAPPPPMEKIPVDMICTIPRAHTSSTRVSSILSMFSVFADPSLGSLFDFDLEKVLDDCLLQANIRLQCERGVKLKAERKHRRRMKKWKNYKFIEEAL